MRHTLSTASRWLAYARDDLTFARETIEKSGHYHFVLFHAQQAAEKALKALLYFHRYPRDLRFHSVARLIKVLQKKEPEARQLFWRDALLITRYYAPTRYPDAYPFGKSNELYTREDAEEAISIAGRMLDWVSKKITGQHIENGKTDI